MITYFSKYSERGPSSRYRVYQLEPFLSSAGVNVRIFPLLDDRYFDFLEISHDTRSVSKKWVYTADRFWKRFKQLRKIDDQATIIEHQLFPYLPYAFESRLLPDQYWIEFDDAIYLTHPAKLPALLLKAQGVIAGNEVLASFARTFNSNVHVIPTVLDTDSFRPLERGVNDRIIIGWSGLAYNFKHLYMLTPVLSELQQRYDVDVAIISNARPGNLPYRFRYEVWDPKREVHQINQFDVGVMPLEDNEWSRGKCGMKLLQYMALGIASVASPVGVNQQILQHGTNGLLASSTADWLESLRRFVEQPNLREQLGKCARQTVEDRFSVRAWLPRITQLYNSLRNNAVERAST